MEKNGIVRIRKDRKDKRATKICLTTKGKILFARMGLKAKKHFNSIFRKYSDKKKRELLKLLKDLRNCFIEYEEKHNGGNMNE